MTVTRNQIDATIEQLCRQFPETFFLLERRRVPLKAGIFDDLLAICGAEIDRELLGAALRFYTSNLGYLKRLKPGASRIDLEGEACGAVSEVHAQSAREALAALKAIAPKSRKPKPAPKPKAAPAPMPAPASAAPKRDGLAALREAAARRKAVPA